MSEINLKALALATLAVFGIDIISGMMLMAVFGGHAMDQGMTDEQVRAALAVMNQNQGYLISALILGTASTVVGGYLAARLARTVPYFNALAFGALGLVVSALTSEDLPTWFKVLGFGLTLPAALFGGHVAKQQLLANRK
jgi:CBS domain containing-hemolysin-like protein